MTSTDDDNDNSSSRPPRLSPSRAAWLNMQETLRANREIVKKALKAEALQKLRDTAPGRATIKWYLDIATSKKPKGKE